MAPNKLYKILSQVVDLRPGETIPSFLLFLYFFLITSPAYIVKPIRVSLFLGWLSSERLPYAYLLTAVLIGFVVTLNSKLLSVLKRQLFISVSLAFFLLSLILFWGLFQTQRPWISLIYWFWSDIFVATSVTQFWILVHDIYHPRQAKRLTGFFVSGGLLGGIAGSVMASRLAPVMGTEDLLLICPLMLIGCLLIVNSVYNYQPEEKKEETEKARKQRKKPVGYGESFHLLKKNRYLILLAGIMASAIVVTTLVDFQFNTIVEQVYAGKDVRTSFLGTFFTALLVFSYILHVSATTRILKNFGMRAALLVAPVFLLVSSTAVFLVPMAFLIHWAVIIKGGDKSLAHSLNQSVRELLYIPVSPDIKYKAKVFIDMFVNKFARGFGALLILLFFTVLHFSVREMSVITLGFVALWIFLSVMIVREYVGIVKEKLKIKWQDADKLVKEKVDVDMTKLVFDTLHSKDRSSVLYAMNLFDLIQSRKMSPELKKIISQKSDEIQASSMDSLLELDGEALMPEEDETLNEEDLDSDVKEIMSLDVYQELMKKHIDSIVNRKEEVDEVSRMEAAKVLGMMDSTSPVITDLRKLLKDPSPEVVRYAAESAGKLKKREFVPLLIQQLNNSSTQEVASEALVEYGTKITGALKDYLGDPEEDLDLRKAIPGILSQIGTQRAADLLSMELRKDEDEVESEIIEAMYKMRSHHSQLQFQEKITNDEIKKKIKESYQVLMELYEIKDDKKKASRVSDLERHLAQLVKQIFELLSLIYPYDDINKAYQNICAGTKKAIDYSVELLDTIIKRKIKDFLLPLIDDLPFEDKVKRCRKLYKTLEKV